MSTCPGVDGSDDPGLGALDLNPPGRTPTMAISAGSNAVDVAVGTSPLDDQRGVARPQGAAADIGAYELEVPTAVPPVSSITLSPADPDGSNGWYTSAVGVTVAATDADGDLAQTRCALDPAATPSAFADLPDASCAVTSVGTDGDHVLYAASVDAAGNEKSPLVSATFRIDRTGPVVQPSLSASSPIGVGQGGVTALANATDATSGVASSGCGTVDTSTPGAKTVTCTATDNAGNETSVTLDYVVEYRILGFFEPVPGSKWKLGQTVPAKVALADAAGTRISDAEASALARACRVQFSASGAQTRTPICAKYDAANDQFVATWKLGKRGTGPATIRMAVGYPGTTVQTRADAVDHDRPVASRQRPGSHGSRGASRLRRVLRRPNARRSSWRLPGSLGPLVSLAGRARSPRTRPFERPACGLAPRPVVNRCLARLAFSERGRARAGRERLRGSDTAEDPRHRPGVSSVVRLPAGLGEPRVGVT